MEDVKEINLIFHKLFFFLSTAGRIHISTTTNHYLTNIIGGYVTEPRGEVIIKGKGVMETFWLLGHSGDSNITFGGSDVPERASPDLS